MARRGHRKNTITDGEFQGRVVQSRRVFDVVEAKVREGLCNGTGEYLYLISILDLIDMYQWCAYTEKFSTPGFGNINMYISEKIGFDTDTSLAISKLSDIRCKFAHRDYKSKHDLYDSAKEYIDMVELLYDILSDLCKSIGSKIMLEK